MSISGRILTTHCGSLPRPSQLSDLLLRQEAGEQIDSGALQREASNAVRAVLDRTKCR
jgi:5-methyltetrahydropteroyltriglutamate--homocysteine methyltransferase